LKIASKGGNYKKWRQSLVFDSTLRREIRIRDRFRKTFLRVKSVLTESKNKQQRNKVNNLKKTGQKEILFKYKWKFRWIKISQWQIILENHENVNKKWKFI
jgi:hypothetical protein